MLIRFRNTLSLLPIQIFHSNPQNSDEIKPKASGSNVTSLQFLPSWHSNQHPPHEHLLRACALSRVFSSHHGYHHHFRALAYHVARHVARFCRRVKYCVHWRELHGRHDLHAPIERLVLPPLCKSKRVKRLQEKEHTARVLTSGDAPDDRFSGMPFERFLDERSVFFAEKLVKSQQPFRAALFVSDVWDACKTVPQKLLS
jgi:hypothetical protein